MKLNEFSKLLFDEVKSISAEIKDVRQKDIPNVHVEIANLKNQLTTLKEEVSKDADRKAKIYGATGGLVATLIALVSRHMH